MMGEGRNKVAERPPLFGSCRMTLALVIMMGTFTLFHLRINLNFAVVCMVKQIHRNHSEGAESSKGVCGNVEEFLNGSEVSILPAELRPVMGEFEWSKEYQAMILGAIYWGYAATQAFGGFFSDRYGSAKKLILIGMGIYSILTFLIPVAARWNPSALIAIRVVQGLASGLSLPSFNVLFSRWTTRDERSTLMSIGYSGYTIASVVTFPMGGFLCEYGFAGGWPSIFYVGGSLGLLWCLAVAFLVYDFPSTHPRISADEHQYLQLNATPRKAKKGVNCGELCRLFTAPPILAFMAAQFCVLWGFYSLIVNLPIYMQEVLDFNIASNGLYSAIPYLIGLAAHYILGPFCDWLTKRKFCSLTLQRKIFTAIGCLFPSVIMFCIGLLDCDNRLIVVLLLSVSSFMSEFAFVGGFQYSIIDIAPDYAGLISGVSNTIATSSGFVSPTIVAAITPEGTREEWLVVFYISGGIYIFGAVVYSIFGTSDKLELAKKHWNPEKVMADDPVITPLSIEKI